MLWEFSVCVWLAPQIPQTSGSRGRDKWGKYIFIYVYVCIFYTYAHTHTQWQHSAHQNLSGFCCIRWLEEQLMLTWSFHLGSKEEALWTLVLLTQRSASWNWRSLLEPYLEHLETWICPEVVAAEISAPLTYEVLNIFPLCTGSFILEMVFTDIVKMLTKWRLMGKGLQPSVCLFDSAVSRC